MKNRTKGRLMIVGLYSFIVFLMCLITNSFVPALIAFSVIFVFYYFVKASELINSDD